MDQQQLIKQMVNFNKGAFNNAFNAMVMVQDQTENLASTMLNQAAWLPEAGKKVIDNWVDALKNGRQMVKKSVDEAFTKMEDYL